MYSSVHIIFFKPRIYQNKIANVKVQIGEKVVYIFGMETCIN